MNRTESARLVGHEENWNSPLHLADNVAPLEVTHAIVQSHIVRLVVITLSQDPLLVRVFPACREDTPGQLKLGEGQVDRVPATTYSSCVSITRWTMGIAAPGIL